MPGMSQHVSAKLLVPSAYAMPRLQVMHQATSSRITGQLEPMAGEATFIIRHASMTPVEHWTVFRVHRPDASCAASPSISSGASTSRCFTAVSLVQLRHAALKAVQIKPQKNNLASANPDRILVHAHSQALQTHST